MKLNDKKILVTGGAGFLGSFVVEELIKHGVPKENIFVPRSKDFDLRKWENCEEVTKGQDIVIHLAANTGGAGYHKDRPGELFYDNLIMNVYMMEASRLSGVEKYVSIGSVTAYPELAPMPFREDDIWNGYPQKLNAPYSFAKLIQLVQAQAYHQQYGFSAIHIMPVNMYGPNDKFDLLHGHVIPSLIRKVEKAKKEDAEYIDAWGTGEATREFLYIEDAAHGIVLATEGYDKPDPVNLGSGMETSIKDLVELICKLMGFEGKIRWDTTKPDGQPRRMLDVTRAEEEFGFKAETDLEEGIKRTIEWWEKEGYKKYEE